MIELYGLELSAPVNKVRYLFNYMGIDYSFKRVNLREGQQRSESFLKLNPVGKVPAIKDGDFVLFESSAIMRYIARKESSELYPAEPQERAIVDQWLDFVALHIATAMGRVFYNRILAPAVGDDVDERSIDTGLKFLKRHLPIVESQIVKHGNLASAELSLPDFALLAHLDLAEPSDYDLSPYTALCSWRDQLRAQPFYTQCHESYGETLGAMTQ